MNAQDYSADLAAFLDDQGAQILEEISSWLKASGEPDGLPVQRALFDLAAAYIRAPSTPRPIGDIQEALAVGGPRIDIQAVISGQIALWMILHEKLREMDATTRKLSIIHALLALAGDTIDGLIGALIDIARSGVSAPTPPGWDTLVELGRTHREFRMLNRITRDLLDARDATQMFESLERGILGAFHLRSLVIAAVNRKEGFVEVVRSHPASTVTRDPIGWRMDLSGPDILSEVVRTGRTEVVDGWDPRFHERIVEADGRFSFRQRPIAYNTGQTSFFVPILARDGVIGVVATGAHQGSKKIVLREIERMRPVLDQVGIALSIVSKITERQRAEQALLEAYDALEQRIIERTAELSATNQLLQREIAEHLQTELKLTQLAAIVESSDDAIIGKTLDGRIVSWNSGAERVFGYTAGEAAGRSISLLIPPDRHQEELQILGRIRQGERIDPYETTRRRKDGALIDVSVTHSPTRDAAGNITGASQIARDITTRKRAEEALREAQRLEVLNQAAVAAAHEIFQPLSAVIGFSELLLDTQAFDGPQKDYLRTIRDSGWKISEIVKKMKNIQRYTTTPYLNERMVDLNEAARREP